MQSAVWSKNAPAISAYAFNDCSSLTEVTIPDSVKTIHYSAFSNCPLICISWNKAITRTVEDENDIILSTSAICCPKGQFLAQSGNMFSCSQCMAGSYIVNQAFTCSPCAGNLTTTTTINTYYDRYQLDTLVHRVLIDALLVQVYLPLFLLYFILIHLYY